MKRIGTYHLLVNLSAVALFAVNLWLRLSLPESSRVPLLLSIVGVLGIGIGGWLGGKMVYVKGMAVQAVEELSRKEQQRGSRSDRVERRSLAPTSSSRH